MDFFSFSMYYFYFVYPVEYIQVPLHLKDIHFLIPSFCLSVLSINNLFLHIDKVYNIFHLEYCKLNST